MMVKELSEPFGEWWPFLVLALCYFTVSVCWVFWGCLAYLAWFGGVVVFLDGLLYNMAAGAVLVWATREVIRWERGL